MVGLRDKIIEEIIGSCMFFAIGMLLVGIFKNIL